MYCDCSQSTREDFAKGKGNAPDHYENGGEDVIDRTFRTGTTEEIRGAMKFNITKYADRLGKKDSEIDELTKIINYATRYRNHLINKGNK